MRFLVVSCFSFLFAASFAQPVTISIGGASVPAGERLVNLGNVVDNIDINKTYFLKAGKSKIALDIVTDENNRRSLAGVVNFQPGMPANYELHSVKPGTKNAPVAVKRTQAELWTKVTGKMKNGFYVGGGNFYRFDSIRVPDNFKDHAYFIKYEGPGWESDKVGYRMYLDQRNAVDVFGKRVATPVLQDVGVDGYETYHHLQDWGMDVLKVGKALGVGSIARMNAENQAVRVEKTDSVFCRVIDGNLQSRVITDYYGYEHEGEKVNLRSVKTIEAASRMTLEELHFSSPVDRVCTGIIADKKAQSFVMKSSDGKWTCLATWGPQSLNNDNLGLAILASSAQNPRIENDKLNNLMVFDVTAKELKYYFLSAWELEPSGIKTLEQFKEYLQKELDVLASPVKVVKQ
jgi:hypothetical protein